MTQISNDYEVRGRRVQPMKPQEIQAVASYIVKKFNIHKGSLQHMDRFIERLWHEASISIDVVADKDWLNVANAWFDPVNYQISIPERCYNALLHKRLTKAKKRAITILFHELGHLSLSHKAVLHHSDVPICQYEDAEWQADYFADEIMILTGIHQNRQLSLF